jgi:hypothetical protein
MKGRVARLERPADNRGMQRIDHDSCRPRAAGTAIAPCALAAVSLSILLSLADELLAAPPVNRARPPRFSKSVEEVFFPDARQQLVGPRPAGNQSARVESSPASAPSEATGSLPPADHKWSKLISPEAIEDEIKAQQIRLREAVSSPARFKAGEYQNARVHLGILTALFAIDAEHDQPVRWKRDAPAVRDALARAASATGVGSNEAYQEVEARAQDLEGLIRGNPCALPAPTQTWDWSKFSERAGLMKRLEQAQKKGLAGVGARGSNLGRSADEWSREAQLIAALAEIIGREEQDASEAKAYREHADAMRSGALTLREAIERKNAEQMRTSLMEIGKACDACHAGFRD